MKKLMAFLSLAVICMMFSVTSYAETLKLPIEGEFCDQPNATPVRDWAKTINFSDITLDDDENALIVRFQPDSGNEMEYYVSLYDWTEMEYVTENDIPGCPQKMVGPISAGEFRLTGLKSGNTYSVYISTAINFAQLTGGVYGAYLEPAAETSFPHLTATASAGGTKDLSANLPLTDDSTVSRADMSVLIRNLLPPERETVQSISFSEYPFSDVPEDAPFKAAVDQLIGLKVINGVGGGKFLPDGVVTNAVALKMIVCSLGYGEYAESLGGWPEGYLACGRELGLYDGDAPDSIAVWQDIHRMLSRAYCLPHLCMSEYSADGKAVYYQNPDITYANIQ